MKIKIASFSLMGEKEKNYYFMILKSNEILAINPLSPTPDFIRSGVSAAEQLLWGFLHL